MNYRLFIAEDNWRQAWQTLLTSVNPVERAWLGDAQFYPISFGWYADLELIDTMAASLSGFIKSQSAIEAFLLRHEQITTDYHLACFDMDSTLIQAECIVELAGEHGVMDAVDRITEEAMAGNLDFKQSFEQRMAMLKGLSETALDNVIARIEYSDGLIEMVDGLKEQGIKLAVFSGGFDFMVNKLKDELGFDYIHTNRLDIKNGVLTGSYQGEIIDAAAKKKYLAQYCAELGIELKNTIAVGDGANDIPMLSSAGLSFGYRPKAKVAAVVDASIYKSGLDVIPAIISSPSG